MQLEQRHGRSKCLTVKAPASLPTKGGQQKSISSANQPYPSLKPTVAQVKDEHDAAIEAAIAAAAAAAEELEGGKTRKFSDSDSWPSYSKASTTPTSMTRTTPQVMMFSTPGTWTPEQLQAMLSTQMQLVTQKRMALQMGGNSMMGGGGSAMGSGGSLMGCGSMMGFPSQMGVPMLPGLATPPKIDQILQLKHREAMQRSSSLGLHVSSNASPMLHALLGRDSKGRPVAKKHARTRHRRQGSQGMARTVSAAGGCLPSCSMSQSPSQSMLRTASGAHMATHERKHAPHSTGSMGQLHIQRLASAPMLVSRTSSTSSVSLAPMSHGQVSGNMDKVPQSVAWMQHSGSTSTVTRLRGKQGTSSDVARGVSPQRM
jgi:hypothetical protein